MPSVSPAFQFHPTKVSPFALVATLAPTVKPLESKEFIETKFPSSAFVKLGKSLVVEAPLTESNTTWF